MAGILRFLGEACYLLHVLLKEVSLKVLFSALFYLFAIFVSYFFEALPTHVKGLVYADDVFIYCSDTERTFISMLSVPYHSGVPIENCKYGRINVMPSTFHAASATVRLKSL